MLANGGHGAVLLVQLLQEVEPRPCGRGLFWLSGLLVLTAWTDLNVEEAEDFFFG